MAIISTAAAEARHIFRQVTIDDLKFVQAFHFRPRARDEVRPNNLREIAIWLVGGLEAGEAGRKVLKWCVSA